MEVAEGSLASWQEKARALLPPLDAPPEYIAALLGWPFGTTSVHLPTFAAVALQVHAKGKVLE
jgi:hypothetical protein